MSNPTPSKDLIRYDLLVQEALKGVVRRVLIDAGRDGLPGDHHFYISFRTDYPGVRLSQRMREKYPEEMTIVLQHQFWDLGVTEHTFEVGLSFSGIPERLLIPFDALVGFFDPSVQFGLKFELNPEATGQPSGDDRVSAAPQLPKPSVPAPRLADRTPERTATPLRGAGSEPTELKPSEPTGAAKPAPKASEPKPSRAAKDKTGGDEVAQDDSDDKNSGQVVSLDAFRKKT